MRLRLESWDPEFQEVIEPEDEAAGDPAVPVEDAEGPVAPEGPGYEGPLVFVDGVERVEAHLWVNDRHPGLLYSFAVGAVRLDPDRAALVGEVVTGRYFVSAEAEPLDLGGPLRYEPLLAAGDRQDLVRAARERRRAAELALGDRLIAAEPGVLLVQDGPLDSALLGRGSATPRLGFVKSHRRRYLAPGDEERLMPRRAGERTPVLEVPSSARRSSRPFYTWYLRLPLRPEGVFSRRSAIARVETDAGLRDAVRLADLSLPIFTRLASEPYRDPRAPVNLLPVGGLESELRRRLGDRRLVLRRLSALVFGAG